MEKVADADLDEWFDLKHAGAGRDKRLQETVRGVGGARSVRLSEALPSMTQHAVDPTKVPGWPLEGPRLSADMLTGVVSTGHELLNHPDVFLNSAGVNPKGGLSNGLVRLYCLPWCLRSCHAQGNTTSATVSTKASMCCS